MGEQMPAILGVMACTRCLAVKAFTAATVKDFERCDGQAWEHCPGCQGSAWFMPFDPTPKAGARGEGNN